MAYVNATIDEGSNGTFQNDTAAAVAIPLYSRVKFSSNKDTSRAAKPTIILATASDRGVGVAMQPIAVGSFGVIRFLNAPGEQYGVPTGTIAAGALVYTAAAGQIAPSGTVVAGYATTDGFAGGPFTYMVQSPLL